jgi:transposase
MKKSKLYQWIPTNLITSLFEEFILPHLPPPSKYGRKRKLSWHTILNYILYLLHTGCQWDEIPIRKNDDGKPEIHYSNLHRALKLLKTMGVIGEIFLASVERLKQEDLLDISVIHGDGTTTVAKKGGDNLGYNGHKHMQGDKVVALCDRNGNVIAPFIAAPGNRNESPLLIDSLQELRIVSKEIGLDFTNTIASFDGVYDCHENRKTILNFGMTPNIPENKRGRKKPKRGRKRRFDPDIFEERFSTIERVFAWEDKFKRLLLRFERMSKLHYALKLLAYTMINLRHFRTV